MSASARTPVSPPTPEKHQTTIVGSKSSGKSALVDRHLRGTYYDGDNPTIAARYLKQSVDSAGKKLDLAFWDISGDDKYDGLLSMYLKQAHHIIFCIDPTQPLDTPLLQNTLEKIMRYSKTNYTVTIAITKEDQAYSPIELVTTENITQHCMQAAAAAKFDREKIRILFVSAKNNTGVREIFNAPTPAPKKAAAASSDPASLITLGTPARIAEPLFTYADKFFSLHRHKERAKTLYMVIQWALENNEFALALLIVQQQKFWLQTGDESFVFEYLSRATSKLPKQFLTDDKHKLYLFSPSKELLGKQKIEDKNSDFYKVLCSVECEIDALGINKP